MGDSMTCLCNAEATEVSRELIPAAVYPTNYEITGETKVEVAYKCETCKLKFWVWEKEND
jgi:uncharacterized protein with PIN domain